MPSEVSTAGADQNRGRTVEELERELSEARQQQTATSEILRTISISPTDAQPVFDAIVASAVRLLRGNASSLTRIEGESDGACRDDEYRRRWQRRSEGALSTAARLRRGPRPGHPHSNAAQYRRRPRRPSTARSSAGLSSYSWLPKPRGGTAAPSRRGDRGARRLPRESGGFTDNEIALLKTFADQAVIAIENTRLFEEAQEKNRTLTKANVQLNDALEEQTATSEILRIISSSPTDTQPTFYAIAECATRLCDAINGLVFRYDGELLHLAAHHNVIPERLDAVKQVFPRRANIGSVAGRVAMRGAVTHVEDITLDPDYALPFATTAGYRSVLGVPMLREGAAIGVILVAREHVAPFSNKQIKLLQTFADQAVIAIENTRLFEEVQASTARADQSRSNTRPRRARCSASSVARH